MKTSRSRFGVLLEHEDFIAEREKIEPKQLLALALELVSKKSYDRDISDICREIIDKGSFSGVLNKVQISKCAYILDSLEIRPCTGRDSPFFFDTKMAGLLDGAGGASCHLCTATDNQIKSLEWVNSGFPINRLISDARQLFEEVDEDYLNLPSNQRVGITHQPTSNIDIIAASPLHAYLCVFRWFMLSIYHLDAGHKVCVPSNSKVNSSMKRVRDILQGRCNFSVNIPSSQSGISTTGNIARDCFLNKRDFLTWATSPINPSDKISLRRSRQIHLFC
ncbi:hypothetical protein LOD99_14244 [Oopsacas minuta]|uniref:Uncharacterized protein n=1 Tax=Oopsacas minuta TaxID=111878 RepID=A0AAV7KH57_9METZ|nr:hypothetical protein LOD99_14244 [Oopsacas minuta]